MKELTAKRLEQPTESERHELDHLMETFRQTSPRGSRRDLLKWAAVAGGAVATARLGVGSASAAPASRSGGWSPYYQDDEVLTKVTVNLPLDPYGQAVTLDPHRTVNWGAFWVLFPNIWGSLVRFDENGKVQLDLAESYTVSTDGTVYTFKIRPDAKYASGNKVVAADFVASWKRALDPSHLSPMAPFMSQLKNFTRFTTRKSKNIGFNAVDESTVEITLTKPYSYFMSYLAAFVWAVVDPKVLADKGDDGFTTADAGTGPWRVTSFDPAKEIVLEPNTNY